MTNRQRSKSGLPRTDEPDARTGAPSLQEKAHRLIPGGCHTYAKGDDQYPAIAPSFIVKGKGCHVWDLEGRNFIEYGMGLRSVTLGHAYEPVLAAVKDALEAGANFTRPAPIEVACAEALLDATKCGEQVKFSKDGSSVVTAAVKLARAYTGRDMVAACADHPFFSYDDWWIGTTSLDGGIPSAFPALTAKFRYNDIDGLRALFDRFGARIACVVLEPARTQEPEAGFLESVRDLCSSRGAVLIFDEMITGFRWSLGGGQESYGVKADLSTFGKAMANGFSVSALVGRRDIMDLGGAGNPGKKVFLLSTTHGAETHALAAALRTIQIRKSPSSSISIGRAGGCARGLKARYRSCGSPPTLGSLDARATWSMKRAIKVASRRSCFVLSLCRSSSREAFWRPPSWSATPMTMATSIARSRS
jgi:glutamate-1-semialdehyde 2,1-aminomutase